MPPLTVENQRIRAQNVSASEVGALMGEHPYSTPGKIWDRLMTPDAFAPEPSEAMRNGSDLEPAIAHLAGQRLGLRLRACTKTYEHPVVRLCATPDYYVLGQPPGLLEVKLSGRPELWPISGPVPAYVEWQARAQMACAKRDTVAVCVFVSMGLRTYLIDRDYGLEAMLLDAVGTFWNDHVATGIRPGDVTAPLTLDFAVKGNAK